MRTTPEQELAIANRLGITRPEQPQEVADYLTAWDNYAEAVDNYKAQRLSTWSQTPEQIRANAEAILQMRNDLKHIWQLGEIIEAFSQTTKLATKAWQDTEQGYLQAVEAEIERPKREFEKAKYAFIQALEKEQRSLKYKTSRFRGWDTPAEYDYQAWTARYELLGYLVNEARYIEATPEAPIFTEEAILAKVLENTYWADTVITKLAVISETANA